MMNWIKRLFTKKPKKLPPFKPLRPRDDRGRFIRLRGVQSLAMRDRLCYERLKGSDNAAQA